MQPYEVFIKKVEKYYKTKFQFFTSKKMHFRGKTNPNPDYNNWTGKYWLLPSAFPLYQSCSTSELTYRKWSINQRVWVEAVKKQLTNWFPLFFHLEDHYFYELYWNKNKLSFLSFRRVCRLCHAKSTICQPIIRFNLCAQNCSFSASLPIMVARFLKKL